MELSPALIIGLVAAAVMMFCLYLVFTVGKKFNDRVVGKQWRYLIWLVVLFTFGYIALPFFGELPPETMHLVVSFVFLFGAVYVLITIKLIKKIVDDLTA
ncbi:MAG: hypothetical protein L3J22_05295 [Xanthomonadales bacterium]|nr:hypothetical protein [Xanthomonadales bacterium]